MRALGLDPLSKKKVGQYSLGMRERLGIAQAIMEDPELLILDEPFNGLDKQGAGEVCELLRGLKERGKTILIAAHNMLEIEWLCAQNFLSSFPDNQNTARLPWERLPPLFLQVYEWKASL